MYAMHDPKQIQKEHTAALGRLQYDPDEAEQLAALTHADLQAVADRLHAMFGRAPDSAAVN